MKNLICVYLFIASLAYAVDEPTFRGYVAEFAKKRGEICSRWVVRNLGISPQSEIAASLEAELFVELVERAGNLAPNTNSYPQFVVLAYTIARRKAVDLIRTAKTVKRGGLFAQVPLAEVLEPEDSFVAQDQQSLEKQLDADTVLRVLQPATALHHTVSAWMNSETDHQAAQLCGITVPELHIRLARAWLWVKAKQSELNHFSNPVLLEDPFDATLRTAIAKVMGGPQLQWARTRPSELMRAAVNDYLNLGFSTAVEGSQKHNVGEQSLRAAIANVTRVGIVQVGPRVFDDVLQEATSNEASAVRLFYLEQRTLQEISIELNTNVEAIKTLLKSARTKALHAFSRQLDERETCSTKLLRRAG